jgi:PAS domain S-box-containing protein
MGIRILVVDDDRDLLQLIEEYLLEQDPNFEIHSTVSTQDALRLIEEKEFDAIVSDYYMGPDQRNGIELLEWLRDAGNTIPFIIFTGRGREEVAIRALNLGADFYLKKDEADLENLFVEIAHHIKNSVESRRVELALHESEARFRGLFESSLDGIVALDSQRKIIRCNSAFAKMLGIKCKNLVGASFLDFVPEAWHDVLDECWIHIEHEGTAKVFAQEMIAKDGRILPVSITAWRMFNQLGKWIGCWCIMRDLSDHEIWDSALHASQQRFETIFRQSPIAMAIFHQKGNLVDANDSCLRIFGLENVRDIQGYSFFDDPDLPKNMKDTLRRGEPIRFNRNYDFKSVQDANLYPTNRSDVAEFQIDARPFGIDKKGNPLGFSFQMQDVTESKRALQAARDAEQRFELIFDNTPVGLSFHRVIFDDNDKPIDYVFLDINSAFEEFTGYARAIVNQKRFGEISKNEFQIPFDLKKIFDKIFSLDFPVIVEHFTDQRGRTFSITAYMPMPDIIVTAIADISQEAETYEQLQQQREELSQFAHQMKHDINNYIFKIRGFIDRFEKKPDPARLETVKRILSEMKEILEHSVELADAGLSVKKGDIIDFESILHKATSNHDGAIELDIHGSLPKVKADETKLMQILQNIIQNAIEHGKATVLEIRSEKKPDSISIIISNNGKPIPEHIKPIIFKKGVTTSAKGTGFGLVIVKRLVEAHGWDIRLVDTENAAFEIIIPDKGQGEI